MYPSTQSDSLHALTERNSLALTRDPVVRELEHGNDVPVIASWALVVPVYARAAHRSGCDGDEDRITR